MTHIKRLAAPVAWRLRRKQRTFTSKPSPGPQKYERALTITIVLRDILQVARTTRECKKLLQQGSVLMNGKARKDHRFAVGLFDIIDLPLVNERYMILYDKTGRLTAQKVSKEAAACKAVKIIGKTMLPGKKIQLNLFDGGNILVQKDEYIVGDTLMLAATNEVEKHLKFERGATIYLIGGKHKGKVGTLEEIKPMEGIQPDRIIFKTKEKTIETLRDYAYVIEKGLAEP